MGDLPVVVGPDRDNVIARFEVGVGERFSRPGAVAPVDRPDFGPHLRRNRDEVELQFLPLFGEHLLQKPAEVGNFPPVVIEPGADLRPERRRVGVRRNRRKFLFAAGCTPPRQGITAPARIGVQIGDTVKSGIQIDRSGPFSAQSAPDVVTARPGDDRLPVDLQKGGVGGGGAEGVTARPADPQHSLEHMQTAGIRPERIPAGVDPRFHHGAERFGGVEQSVEHLPVRDVPVFDPVDAPDHTGSGQPVARRVGRSPALLQPENLSGFRIEDETHQRAAAQQHFGRTLRTQRIGQPEVGRLQMTLRFDQLRLRCFPRRARDGQPPFRRPRGKKKAGGQQDGALPHSKANSHIVSSVSLNSSISDKIPPFQRSFKWISQKIPLFFCNTRPDG